MDTSRLPSVINLAISKDAYTNECDFRALHVPDMEAIITVELPRAPDFWGYADKMDEAHKERILNPELWLFIADEYIQAIKGCIDTRKTKYKDM